MLFFSTDIDGTVYDGPETAAAFASFWFMLGSRWEEKPVLVYNTGRVLADAMELVRTTELPEPDWFVCGVGTTIFHRASGEVSEGWEAALSEGWDFERVRETVSSRTPARPQPAECQGAHKCSWFWEDADPAAVGELEAHLRGMGIAAQAVYSSSRDLDLIPTRANKGNAVKFLAGELGVPLAKVIVAGDSGNDASMYGVEGVRGVVVSNAEKALKDAVRELGVGHHFATKKCAFGVIEGIEFWMGGGNGA